MCAAKTILCIHGVGDHKSDTSWQKAWESIVNSAAANNGHAQNIQYHYFMHNDIFAQHPLGPKDLASALYQYGKSGFEHRNTRAVLARGSVNSLQLPIAMVMQWGADTKDSRILRRKLRQSLAKTINEIKPDIILAHSMGSLIAYDTLMREALEVKPVLVSFGSQIGSQFVRNVFGGRIVEPKARFWFHLFNQYDRVMTESLASSSFSNFMQVNTLFDSDGMSNHDADHYLRHEATDAYVWRSLFAPAASKARATTTARSLSTRNVATRRALLIGINQYAGDVAPLEGCVNDVFRMSEVLQESGFASEDIRVVIDERATTSGIRERLHWLLENTRGGDTRVLYFSGHGAQLPAYNPDEVVDHVDECLVPYDFDWSHDRAITDDDLVNLYSQLDYEVRMLGIFDCCHSGGLSRGSGPKVRGLQPPDDIRHRAIRWDSKIGMWVPRELPEISPAISEAKKYTKQDKNELVGLDGATKRIGVAASLRGLSRKEFEHRKDVAGHVGPYMPLLLQACQESELAYEYKHGVVSFGAFTFALTEAMRRARLRKQKTSFEALINETAKIVQTKLLLTQTPCLAGPTAWKTSMVP